MHVSVNDTFWGSFTYTLVHAWPSLQYKCLTFLQSVCRHLIVGVGRFHIPPNVSYHFQ